MKRARSIVAGTPGPVRGLARLAPRLLKLAIWDFDATLLDGVWEEGDRTLRPAACRAMDRLRRRGVLQALATQNTADTIAKALRELALAGRFVHVEADLGPKARKVRRVLDRLDVAPQDTVFIDEDAFERDALRARMPGLCAWGVAEVSAYLDGRPARVTREAGRRPRMYREQQRRQGAEAGADDYLAFLRACRIRITVRPYRRHDADRAEELLLRTHRMNLGLLPHDEAVAQLGRPDAHHVLIAEIADAYGDMGRCGIAHLTPAGGGEARIESLAISCRTRARGLSLAMLFGLLRHPRAAFDAYLCRYRDNGSNRPLRMLLLQAGFKPCRGTDQLRLDRQRLDAAEIPDWVRLVHR